jgi:thiol-disulfide isomerase/thioredoxin
MTKTISLPALLVVLTLAVSFIHCSESVDDPLIGDSSLAESTSSEASQSAETLSGDESGLSEESLDSGSDSDQTADSSGEAEGTTAEDHPFPDPTWLKSGDPLDNGTAGTQPGSVAKDFNQPLPVVNMSGWSTVSLYDFYGYVIVLNASAEWCEPCQEETPELEAMFEEKKDDGFVVLQTLFEDKDYNPADERTIKRWDRNFQLSYPVLADSEAEIYIDYKDDTNSMPLSVVIGRDMKIVGIVQGYKMTELQQYIDQAFQTN